MASASHAVTAYLSDLHQSLGAGVPETSGYPALRNLLNAVGDELKPKIVAVLHPSNTGAGIPDGALFTAKALRRHSDDTPALLAVKPERGVIEVKGLRQDISGLEQTPQVRGYLDHYQQVLITNYRTFALFSWENGKPVAGERYVIAPSEEAFWDKVHTLRKDPNHPEHERLWQFLRRALLSNARISTPQDLAAFLASYAREARARVEVAPMGTLEPVKAALSGALGVRFEGEKGTHFFQSTLIQTLFYGIYSAWVLWHESHPKPGDRFHWKSAVDHLGLPILRSLFHQVAYPANIRALNLEEVLDWTEDCLARVDRVSFFARYDMGDAVQYFYEPFLAEFDPGLRKEFGVWYTPPEIVRYMVGRVDRALQENFGLADGLADPSVVVLDPCCGTGAYLVETLKLIRQRLVDGYGESQAGLKIREAAKKRLFGFELLPAPYVVSHLQIDLLLTRWGASLDHEKDERAGVFLTNALTGWVPVKSPKDLPFAEFSEERDAADHVKRQEQILVIIGNPPYDGFADMAVEEERSLSEAYRTTKAVAAPQGQGLNDLYIRFFRMAERRITEGVPHTDDPAPGPARDDAKGIVCYISNYSWLDGLSHTGMRERFMEVFDAISIDSLNGDKYKTGKKTPDGKPDPSVFSTERNREGIQVGTAIAMLERRPGRVRLRKGHEPGRLADAAALGKRADVRFRDWWGKDKRTNLLSADQEWQRLEPVTTLGLPLVPLGARADYDGWPLLPELLAESFPGVQSKQDNLVVDIDRSRLYRRMRDFFDPSVSDVAMAQRHPGSMDGTHAADAKATRAVLIGRGYLPEYLVPYIYRPFDSRWIYWEPETSLLGRKSPELFANTFAGNVFIEARQRQAKTDFDRGYVTTALPDNFGNGFSNFFPLLVRIGPDSFGSHGSHPNLFSVGGVTHRPNLAPAGLAYLTGLGAAHEELFFHTVAVLHAPAYRDENAGALRQDWPRVPLPKSADTLRAGAALGRQLAALLDPEVPVPGVTDLQVRSDLKGIGELAVAPTEANKHPEADLSVAARWGYAGQGEVVMPGPGRVTSGTRGEAFVDVHLNDTTRWKDVPIDVWDYTLCGYQVLKKWLSYRETALLERPLTSDEAQTFTHNVRRIAAI
ncbi:MAG: type ISP restriction/modification enzyme, partial [Vicinamibacterales bacterium]